MKLYTVKINFLFVCFLPVWYELTGADNEKEALFFWNIAATLIAKDCKSEPTISLTQDISCFHVTSPGRKLNKNETQLQVWTALVSG